MTTPAPAVAGPSLSADAAASRAQLAGGRPLLLGLCRAAGRAVVRVLFRLTVRGVEHVPAVGPVLLAGNHTGFLDGPFVFLASPRPPVFLVKSELYVGPLGVVLRQLGQLAVHRDRPDRAALRQARAVLAAGGVVGLFPEGTRGTGELTAVRHGVAYLAVHSGCPVVPVACFGTAAALPKGRWWPRWRAPVDVTLGPAFTVPVAGDPRSRRVIAEAAEEIRYRLLAHLTQASAERTPSGSLPGRGDRRGTRR